jgi:hypothetical protein
MTDNNSAPSIEEDIENNNTTEPSPDLLENSRESETTQPSTVEEGEEFIPLNNSPLEEESINLDDYSDEEFAPSFDSIQEASKPPEKIDISAAMEQADILTIPSNVADIESFNDFDDITPQIEPQPLVVSPAHEEIEKDLNGEKQYSQSDVDLKREEIKQKQKQSKNIISNNGRAHIDVLKGAHSLLKLYTKCNPSVKLLVRELIKIALITNGVNIEIAEENSSTHLSELKLAFKDGDLLNLRVENLILVKPSVTVNKEMILAAAEGAESVSQILQRLQKSPQNQNLRFKIENVLANNRIILPP